MDEDRAWLHEKEQSILGQHEQERNSNVHHILIEDTAVVVCTFPNPKKAYDSISLRQ